MLRWAIGVVAGAGIDVVAATETWTWEQLSLVAECIDDVAVERADLVAMPVVAASGAKWKGNADARRKARRKRERAVTVAALPPQQRDAEKLARISAAGFRVNVATGGTGNGDDGGGDG